MSMSKTEFFDILRDYASLEFADLPQNDIDYEFSPRFKRKMKRLFHQIDKYGFAKRRHTYKMIPAIAAAVLILLTAFMSASAARNSIVNFFIEKYEMFVEFFFYGDLSKKIEYEYSFSELPDGFSEIQSESDDGYLYKEYENSEGDLIMFEQITTEWTTTVLDNENGKITEIVLNGTEVILYQANDEDLWIANWCYDSYFFTISYYGCTSQEELVHVIKLVS